MALISKFELPGTGAVIDNAYFIITQVEVIKRVTPLPHGGDASVDILQGETGYFAHVYLAVYSSKQARQDGKQPVSYITTADPSKPFKVSFLLDINSDVPYIEQGYNFLKGQAYFENAVID